MQTVNIKAISADHTVAGFIVGARGKERVMLMLDGDPAGGSVVTPGREFTELRFTDCATVVIHAPRLAYGGTVVSAGVTWSSSSSDPTIENATRTAQVLAFAVSVAECLNAWVADGSVSVTECGATV